ncbi:unnamed protein product [Prunus armeniaca]|uniref:Uncharacterized protein n=1 Tax=Prunus armeniaca TaxID=36596 RepID=A0A6J5WYT3_PRUAR|nr:unnamed protein product [Prunus armeniaca]
MLIEQLPLVILMVGVYVMLGSVITTTVAQALSQALPGFPDKCGNLTIPYPFGRLSHHLQHIHRNPQQHSGATSLSLPFPLMRLRCRY